MRALFLSSLLLVGMAPAALHAQTSTDLTAADMRRRVAILADDSMRGRDAGQIGNVKATRYVASELKRIGLTPAGDNGYFQTVPLVARGPVHVTHLIVDGVTLPAGSVQGARAIAGAPFGGQFSKQNVSSVYGGVIGRNMVAPVAARGKVVVFQVAVDGNVQIPGNAYAGADGALAPYADAAAIFIVALDRLPMQVVNGMRTARIVMLDPAVVTRTTPGALITTAAANAIFGDELAELAPGVPGKSIGGSFGIADTPLPAPARNVVATLRGTDPSLRNEFVAIGAHTDHMDGASGSVVALEMAEYFVKHPTRRSLLFVFHTAEEKGLLGAAYYTDHPTVPRDSIVAQINMGQVSRGGPDDVAGSQPSSVYVLGTRRLSTELGDLVERVDAQPDHRLRLDYSLDAAGNPLNAYCRGDHYMYARYGIPIVSLSTGFHRDYRMVTDEVRYINPTIMMSIGTFARDIVASVANNELRPLVNKPKPDPNGVCRP